MSRIFDEVLRHLRLLNLPLTATPPKTLQPEKLPYDPAQMRPALKDLWLASDQLCGKLPKAALPGWLDHHPRRSAPLRSSL